ncbi:Cbb3-type cytochrome c oxidase subunit CcoN1 [bacterium HR32]|jgi:cytochrome c oxidase cbb3-type subunit 1|nr:Cbb3-type cytochrome c oxidase subunit CcoN1 [bacterium HR32]
MLAWMFTDERWSAARRFLYAGALWALVAGAYDALVWAQRVWPGLLADFPWTSHGRLVAAARDLWTFGFLSSLLVGAALRVVGQGERDGLWSEPLANLALWLWTAAQLLAVWWLGAGWTRGRPFGEAPWPIDLLRLASALLLLWVVKRTLERGAAQEPALGSLLFGFAALPVVLVLGKGLFWPFANPYAGVVDALAQSFLRGGLTWLWCAPLGAGVALYLVAAVAGRPPWAPALVGAAVVALGALAPLVAPAAFVWGPVPFWVQTVGAVAQALLLLPLVTVLTGIVRPLAGRWEAVREQPGVAFLLAGWLAVATGAAALALASLLGPSRVAHLTLWEEGARLLVTGGFAAVAAGAAYTLTPHVLGRALVSRALAWRHFWVLVGVWALSVPALLLAGLAQGATWATGTVPFAHGAQAAAPFMAVRFAGALGLLGAHGLFAWNLFLTADSGEPVPAAERELVPVTG